MSKLTSSSLLIDTLSLLVGTGITWIIIMFQIIETYPLIPPMPFLDVLIIAQTANGIGWIFSKLFMR